ncbi:MAG TPA: hypothetical protein V6C72_19415 [Chroococcales cyanobacterium]
MSNEPGRDEKEQQAAGDVAGGDDSNKSYKDYLKFLKSNKKSSISMWLGKASDLYSEVDGMVKEAQPSTDESEIVCDLSMVKQGALTKAIEIARTDFVKAKFESEDPVELTEKYVSRLSRLNDEYHLKKILKANVLIVGFMKDKDSKADRLLVTKDGDQNRIIAVDPESAKVLETFDAKPSYCMLALQLQEK